MHLTRTKIALFFATLLILGWFLYPRELLLGYIYEGLTELKDSETSYLDYLKKKPTSKFATLRLASVYERMAEPERATPLLARLFTHRRKDWRVAVAYMDHLDNIHAEGDLYRTRLEVARRFMGDPRFPRGRLEAVLYDALQYAIWQQRTDEIYAVATDLARISRQPASYQGLIRSMDMGLGKSAAVVQFLRERIAVNPVDDLNRQELVSVMMVLQRLDEAEALIDEGLRLKPDHPGLIRLRIAVDDRLGRTERMIGDLNHLLALGGLTNQERHDFSRLLASIYLKERRTDEGIALLEDLIQAAERDSDSKRHHEAVTALASHYLYEAKDAGRLELYRDYLTIDPRPALAQDVGNLLIDQGRMDEAVVWLQEAGPRFPDFFPLQSVRIDALIRERRSDEALHVAQAYLKRHPDAIPALFRLAEVHATVPDRQAAEAVYDRIGWLARGDRQVLKRLGRELIFLGRPDKALDYLKRSAESAGDRKGSGVFFRKRLPTPFSFGMEREPDTGDAASDPLLSEDAEVLFWTMEAYAAKGDSKKARETARQVVALSAGAGGERDRYLLKARGRVNLSEGVRQDYATAFKHHPRSFDLRADYLELLLENREWSEAHAAIAQVHRDFPKEEERLATFEVGLAFGERRWGEAAARLESLLQTRPRHHGYRRDLGLARQRQGRWRSAIAQFEEVRGATGDDYQVEEPLRELHALHDHQITPTFRYTDLGADLSYETGLKTQLSLSEAWAVTGDFNVGFFQDPNLAFDGRAEYGRLAAQWQPSPAWRLTVGGGYGVSPHRKTGSPFLKLKYDSETKVSVTLEGEWRALWTELPQAVAAGALIDRGKGGLQATLADRVVIGGSYEFSRTVLPDGARNLSHDLDPFLSVVLLPRPYLTVGYQFNFVSNRDRGDYASRIPFVRKLSAHYLTAGLSHPLLKNLLVEVGGFIGEDRERHLKFLKTDLWGGRGRVEWGVLSWLDLAASYEYGRETLPTVSGRVHRVGADLSGHWL